MLLFTYIEMTGHLFSFILWITWTDFWILCQPYSPWIYPAWPSCIILFLYLTGFNLPILSLIEKLKFTITKYSLKKLNTKQQCGNFLVSELFIILKYVSVSCSVMSFIYDHKAMTRYDPVDCSSPGSPIPGILQTKTLEWVAISFSSAWSEK